jgi:hypothetical protein
MDGIMSTLKKLNTLFIKPQMWRQYNKLKNHSTANMDDEKLASHRETMRLIEKNLQFATWNAADVQGEDDE